MSSNIISDKLQIDTKLNGLSASFGDKGLTPLNGRYKAKSLSSDKLNESNADRAAILDDAEAHHVAEKSETPGCLVQNKVMEQESQTAHIGKRTTSCKVTALMSPEKYFFHVPQQTRKEWCAAVHKTNVPKSSLYICEDHINVENDLQNYDKWKNGSVRARLKPSVPFLKNILPTSSSRVAEQLSESEHSEILTENKGILCVPESRSRGIQVRPLIVDKSVSINCKSASVDQLEVEETGEETPSIVGTTSEFSATESSTLPSLKSGHNNLLGRQFLLDLILKKPYHYIGIPHKCFWIIKYLEENCKVPYLHIIIVLYKIKNNDSFTRIRDIFEISLTTLWRMFYKIINVMMLFFKQLVYWPCPIDIKRNLPLAFRVNPSYSNVQCIIDGFEIEIEKPNNPVQQSLTWSNYKNCNTIKYLIGATPDGFINFISKGYGGRISDMNLVKQSGFLNTVPENCTILADRGFKHLDTQLAVRNATLLRPPSVLKDIKMTKLEVLQSKIIASLRVHIERVIRRIRLYKLLKPHAVVNNKLVSTLDDIVVIVCGLINLQSPLLQNF